MQIDGLSFQIRLDNLRCDTSHLTLTAGPMSYHLEIRHQLESFFAEPRLWNTLSGGVAFREPYWLAPWCRHFG